MSPDVVRKILLEADARSQGRFRMINSRTYNDRSFIEDMNRALMEVLGEAHELARRSVGNLSKVHLELTVSDGLTDPNFRVVYTGGRNSFEKRTSTIEMKISMERNIT